MKGPFWVAENASLLALATSFVSWGVLLWVGWTAIFCGSPTAVVSSTTSAPADLIGRAYFSGYTLTTLGIGDLVPGDGIWRLATVVAAANGFALLTLFVSYTFSVMTALNARRSLGSAVGHLGTTPEEIAMLLRDGGSQALATHLQNLTSQVESSAMQSDAFPVLEYTHVSERRRSFAVGVVTLGELTLLLEHALQRDNSLPEAVWKPLRGAVDLLIREKHPVSAGTAPPPALPDLRRLEGAGMQLNPNAEVALGAESVQELRTRWAQWLRWHGRECTEREGHTEAQHRPDARA